MSSLETIKQQLIQQKELLESKGIVVNNQNAHPSLLDITNAIDTINFDFSATTATEDDVREGKTFYSQSHELKTGTFDMSIVDELKNQIRCIISGEGRTEINIPEGIKYIRSYMFSSYANYVNADTYYKHNLTIPEGVIRIDAYAFHGSNITGKLVLPASCTTFGSRTFAYSTMDEVEVFSSVSSSIPDYFFAYCSNLKKLTYHAPASYFGPSCCQDCTKLEEVYMPSTLTTMSSSALTRCSALKFIVFDNIKPVTLSTNTFRDCQTAAIIVPYQSYDEYFNATNYQQFNNPMLGHGDFKQNDVLPNSIEGYTLTWYQTIDDAKNQVNPVLICPQEGRMYAVLTEIA